MPFSTLSSKGQITVPVEVRHRLGLKQGDRVEFAFEDDKTVLRPVRPAEDPLTKYIGAFPAFSSKEEIIQFYRDLRGHDEWDEELL